MKSAPIHQQLSPSPSAAVDKLTGPQRKTPRLTGACTNSERFLSRCATQPTDSHPPSLKKADRGGASQINMDTNPVEANADSTQQLLLEKISEPTNSVTAEHTGHAGHERHPPHHRCFHKLRLLWHADAGPAVPPRCLQQGAELPGPPIKPIIS